MTRGTVTADQLRAELFRRVLEAHGEISLDRARLIRDVCRIHREKREAVARLEACRAGGGYHDLLAAAQQHCDLVEADLRALNRLGV